jgi:hypothetical protein
MVSASLAGRLGRVPDGVVIHRGDAGSRERHNPMICVRPPTQIPGLPAARIRRSEIVRAKGNVPVLAVRDREGRQPGRFGHVNRGWCDLPFTRRQASLRPWRQEIELRRDRPQASRSRHCRVGSPNMRPLVLGSGPMPRRCLECKLAAPKRGPSVPRPREDGFWRQMAACPPRTIRARCFYAVWAPGEPGSGGRYVRTHWFGHARLPMSEP